MTDLIRGRPCIRKDDQDLAKIHYTREEIKAVIKNVMRDCYQERKNLSSLTLYHRYHIKEPDLMFPAEIYQRTLHFFNNSKLDTFEQDRMNGIERKTLNQTTFYNRCKELKKEGFLNSELMKVRKNRTRVVYRLLDF